ncbi:efflux RND transporter periplasmic adaptor subunit [Muriicola sp. Z0-33]|uniref:efflux RND transporter periplasmic adaptor subunit n=1 Tax=Muriicola sp. Z0-33 TaxID=2816957 RepID=UPI0022378A9D|nr:efflux RND transporter periplasmic adaptor subunit [Muriicola sp. Z0-33]MCW5515687.1 efflux RND transporter periplasmic adaptor subunit [Muriicola sp. Z0-33]
MKYFCHIVLTALTVLVFGSCKEESEKKEEVLRPVNYQVVGTSDAQKIRSFSGIAKAGDEIELSFRSNGIITELKVTVGQNVKKGDLIAKLDNVQANLAYEQSVSALNSANSAMKTAKSALDRVKSLYESGSQSLSDYEAAKNSYQSALDQYESARRNKSIQQSQINYGYIYAPKDGTIASRPGTLNANVSAGQVIAVLNAGEQINIMVGLPENVINKVQTGMEVDISLSSLEDAFKGSVLEVSPVVDPNSSTYPIKIDIVTPTTAVKPGMAANVTFNFGSGEEANDDTLVVPVKAVGEDSNGNYVFVIKTDDNKVGVVKKQTIEVGELTSDGFKIRSGLEGGEKIATAGLQTLLDGQKVKLQ